MDRVVLVYGAGGHGRVVGDAVLASGRSLAGFIDDAPKGPVWGRSVTTFGALADRDVDAFEVALGIGDNFVRERVYRSLRERGIRVASVVHPSAIVASTATIDEGTVVLARVVVNADARVGVGVVLNTGSIVEHDAKLGDFCFLGPGVALGGTVRVGQRSLLGVGACVKPNLALGDDVVVGAGGAVVRDVPSKTSVVGVPARPIARRLPP